MKIRLFVRYSRLRKARCLEATDDDDTNEGQNYSLLWSRYKKLLVEAFEKIPECSINLAKALLRKKIHAFGGLCYILTTIKMDTELTSPHTHL